MFETHIVHSLCTFRFDIMTSKLEQITKSETFTIGCLRLDFLSEQSFKLNIRNKFSWYF